MTPEQILSNAIIDYINSLTEKERLNSGKWIVRTVINQTSRNHTESIGMLEEIKQEINGQIAFLDSYKKYFSKSLN